MPRKPWSNYYNAGGTDLGHLLSVAHTTSKSNADRFLMASLIGFRSSACHSYDHEHCEEHVFNEGPNPILPCLCECHYPGDTPPSSRVEL